MADLPMAPSAENFSSPRVRSCLVRGRTFDFRRLRGSEVDGTVRFEGDVILGTLAEIQQREEEATLDAGVGRSGAAFRWPDGVVPYQIDPSLPSASRVTDAIAHWEANTSIRFLERTSDNEASHPNFALFKAGTGCASAVGMQGGQQLVFLGDACTAGSAIHEIGHVVGLWHEQSREDRDLYVEIHWENITPGLEHNFDQHVTDGDDLGAYDFDSIMHYPETAFSRNGRPTILARNGRPIGQRRGLSSGDVYAVGLLYGPGHIAPARATEIAFLDRSASVCEMYNIDEGGVFRRIRTAKWPIQAARVVVPPIEATGVDLVVIDDGGSLWQWSWSGAGSGLTRLNGNANALSPTVDCAAALAAGTHEFEVLTYHAGTGTASLVRIADREFEPVQRYRGWRTTWSSILPGGFGGEGIGDLMFVDGDSGDVETWSVDCRGRLSQIESLPRLVAPGVLAAVGNFGGDEGTDLVSYDPSSGVAVMTSLGDSNREVWRITCELGADLLLAGAFGGTTRGSGLLLYRRGDGRAWLWVPDGNGTLKLDASYVDWRTSWSDVVAGRFSKPSSPATPLV